MPLIVMIIWPIFPNSQFYISELNKTTKIPNLILCKFIYLLAFVKYLRLLTRPLGKPGQVETSLAIP